MLRWTAAMLAMGALCGAASAAEPAVSPVSPVPPGMAETLDDFRLNAPAPVLDEGGGGGGKWNVKGKAWIWAPEMNAEAEIEGSSAHLESDYGESWYLGARVEVSRNKFGVLAEFETAATDSDDLSSDYDFDNFRTDLGLLFHVVGDADAGLRVTVYGGGRYQATKQSSGASDRDDWWEPFAGVEARVPVVILDLVGRATFSGFDVGPTKLQTDLSLAAEFTLGPVLLEIGLRYQDRDFTSSSGGGYSLDAQSFGPYLAAGFDF
jgi:hypothetical protein